MCQKTGIKTTLTHQKTIALEKTQEPENLDADKRIREAGCRDGNRPEKDRFPPRSRAEGPQKELSQNADTVLHWLWAEGALGLLSDQMETQHTLLTRRL